MDPGHLARQSDLQWSLKDILHLLLRWEAPAGSLNYFGYKLSEAELQSDILQSLSLLSLYCGITYAISFTALVTRFPYTTHFKAWYSRYQYMETPEFFNILNLNSEHEWPLCLTRKLLVNEDLQSSRVHSSPE